MITYGVLKVIELQFSPPTPDRLIQTYGESSPMGLIWTLMGFSSLYCFFGGAGEVLGGLLLSLRRTTLLGALVCIGVLANVVMINLSFDVPVKLFSSHLLAGSRSPWWRCSSPPTSGIRSSTPTRPARPTA
jgi:hypothetical protein